MVGRTGRMGTLSPDPMAPDHSALLPLGPTYPSELKMQLFREGLDRQALGSICPRP